MAKIEPARNDIMLGGMEWEVATPEELGEGSTLRITHSDIINDDPDYPIADRTAITQLQDGTVHIALDSERNASFYRGNGEFPAGVLRAIVDYVEPAGAEMQQPSSAADGRSLFGRVMDTLTEHASYLRRSASK